MTSPSLVCLTDGELYAGVYIDFMGTDSAIFRTLGKQTAMRTDQYNSRWLNGNVSAHGLFSSQHYFFYSSLSRPVLIYSSAPEEHCCNVSPALQHCPFLEPFPLGRRLLIFPPCSTWPHDQLSWSIKCTMLIVDRVPAEPDSEVSSSVVTGGEMTECQ